MDKKRDSFTFQRYYFEAISTLKNKEKLELYDAICACFVTSWKSLIDTTGKPFLTRASMPDGRTFTR